MSRTEDFFLIQRQKLCGDAVERQKGVRAFVDISEGFFALPNNEKVEGAAPGAKCKSVRSGIIQVIHVADECAYRRNIFAFSERAQVGRSFCGDGRHGLIYLVLKEVVSLPHPFDRYVSTRPRVPERQIGETV